CTRPPARCMPGPCVAPGPGPPTARYGRSRLRRGTDIGEGGRAFRVIIPTRVALLIDMEFGDRDLSSAIARLTRGVEAGSTTPAVHWLGTRRGTDGVSLAASLDDLTTAVRVAAGLDPDPHELRAFALAWAEGALGALRTRGALDPETSLATREYLATRLRDLARLGVAPGSRLVVVGPG